MFCHSSDAVRQCKSKSLQNDPFNLSSSEILEKASPSSIVSFFRELIFIHLFQMVKADTPDADNMNAIFEIISKTVLATPKTADGLELIKQQRVCVREREREPDRPFGHRAILLSKRAMYFPN